MASARKSQPEALIVASVIAAKASSWNASTQKVAAEDAQRILEALVAEVGIDGARVALTNHGFEAASYAYLLGPLYREALARRERAGVPNVG